MSDALPSDPPRRRVDLDGGPLAYTDEGEGPPLIALHGLPGSARDWRWLCPQVTPALRFIRVDLPGFGETPLSTLRDPSFEGRAGLVIQLADALDLERFAVIGHSIGGPLALTVAALAPERVSALALLASVGLRAHRGYRKAASMLPLMRLLELPLVGRALRPMMRKAFRDSGFPAYPDEALLQVLRIVRGVSFLAIEAHAASVVAPTLVAWAKDDPLVEASVSRELAAALPAGPRFGFDRGGHNIQKSHAGELGAALITMIDGSQGADP